MKNTSIYNSFGIYTNKYNNKDMSKIANFDEYTKESAYKPNGEGILEKQEWHFYKDFYPEKYEDIKIDNLKFCYIIKQNDIKKMIISGNVSEDSVISILEILKNTEKSVEDGDIQMETVE